MSVDQQILAWSQDQPAWRRDALRRLMAGALSVADEAELLVLLLADHNLAETDKTAVVLAKEHLADSEASADAISLLSLSDVANANRLAPGQTLEFGATGITLVYGDNGSGKSGYARVLKKACRARLAENILGDIFNPAATKKAATALINISINGVAETPIGWEDGKPGPGELSRIAVFDSKCASVYVDSENQLTFIPYNLDCFERLVQVCDRLKDKLVTQQTALKAATAVAVLVLPEGSAGKAFLDKLATKSDDDIAAATAWTESDTARLTDLSKLVADPGKRALTLRQIHAEVKAIRDSLDVAAPPFSTEAVGQLLAKRTAVAETRQAADLAAATSFSDEPLPGVGSEPWRMLYEAARAYSEATAYVGHDFPVTEDDAHCVLCQQTLGPEGRSRMQRFDEFVRGEITKKAEAATVEWNAALAAFRGATSSINPIAPVLDVLLASEEPSYRTDVGAALAQAIKARGDVEKIIAGAEAGEYTPPVLNLAALDGHLAQLEAAATAAEQAAKDEDAAKLRDEFSALQVRHQLHTHRPQIDKRVADLRTLKLLDGAIKACNTAGISAKGTELLKEHVSGKFAKAVNNERKALGVGAIPLKINARSPKGTPSHQLKLDQTTFTGNTSAILSEGEHRAVALAAFLAEQEMIPGAAPIIIDDPVSSLDDERRQKVARRLVGEAKKRQVIVFTHDLLFYTDVTFICGEMQVPLKKVGIRRGAKGYGTIDPDGDPWAAKGVGRRKNWLAQQHAKLVKFHVDGKTEDYEKEARFFYDRLRETWERLIEEGLFANVVVRYRRGVETKRLTAAVVNDDLASRVYNGMSAISEYTAHDRPAAAGANWPDPDTMKEHLDALESCWESIEKEAKATEKRREKLEKAPAPAAVVGSS